MTTLSIRTRTKDDLDYVGFNNIFFLCSQTVSLYYCCSVAKSCMTLCDPWTAAPQASLSLTISQSLPKFMSVESVYYNLHIIAFLLWSLQRTSCVCRRYLPDSTWQVPSSFLPVSLWARAQWPTGMPEATVAALLPTPQRSTSQYFLAEPESGRQQQRT